MKLPFLLAIPIVLSVFFERSACAQNAALPQEKSTVAGTVIDAVSERPLKGAEVRLRAIPGTTAPGSQSASQSSPQSRSANTDAGGRFVFESLSPGRYVVLATHDGYVKNAREYGDLRGKWLLLAPGQHVSDIVVRLLPNGTIAGRVRNEAGKPLRGVSVQAMKSSYPHGKRELHDVANASTNDAGEYRILALAPGKYCIRAKLPTSLKARPGSDKAYVPIYYPAANDPSRSVTLVLRAAEDLAGIDMNLALVPTVHIRGRVINARTSLPSKEAEVTLLSDQGETIFSPYQNFSAGGQANFEFQGVPPGFYVLVAQQPSTPHEPKTMWGRTSIEVKETNLEHVEVVVGPGVDVSGRIRVEGDTAVDLSKEINHHRMSGILESQEASSLASLTPDIDNATVNADGTFIFREVPEGNYRINFFPVPEGFYLRSSGSSDMLETGITVGRGHSPAAVELVLSPGAGRIDGTVESDEQSAPGASVVLVPDGKGRGQPNYYRQSVTDLLGRFAMRNIIPGDYTLFAWEQIDRGAYFDPEFLGRYEDRGTAVHVEEGGHLSVKLDVIPAAETVP
jgi:protocatechuate 3,4-dioxygenase beta subunit